MKKALIAIAALLVTASAFAQGQVQFNNRITGTVDARVFAVGGVDGFVGTAELVNAANGSVVATTTFRNTSAAAQGYVNAVTATVPGVAGGASASLILRAYSGAASYEAAKTTIGAFYGQSAAVSVTLAEPPATPPALAGLAAFTVVPGVPEPSTIAIGALGLAALLLRRRK